MLKKRRILALLVAVILLAGCTKKQKNEVSTGFSLVDDLNTTVNFETHPTRIISLAPSLTEMIYKIGYDKYLVGNTLYCNFPEDAKKKTRVGDLLTVDF